MIGTYGLEGADKLYDNNKIISKRDNMYFNRAAHLDVTTKARMN